MKDNENASTKDQSPADILLTRWITTRNNNGRLETTFRGGLTEILEELKKSGAR